MWEWMMKKSWNRAFEKRTGNDDEPEVAIWKAEHKTLQEKERSKWKKENEKDTNEMQKK